MVRRLRKRKSCWQVIAIPLASIAAPTLTVMQGFEAKKRLLRVHFPPRSICSVFFNSTQSQTQCELNPITMVYEAEHDNHYTVLLATKQLQNVVFKPNA